ncbi:MAG TPA: hypothetical protein VME68_08570 [Acidobacteriaceae bacterium]|nr:hypothetical protein [Acidobacteriaceae bacterium]
MADEVVTQAQIPAKGRGGVSDFRLIPRLETYPRIVAFAQSTLGKIVLLGLFTAGMRYFLPDLNVTLRFVFVFGFITFLPDLRWPVLTLCPLVFLVQNNLHHPLVLTASLLVVATGMFVYWCAMRWPKSRFGRRPLVFLLTGYSLLIVLACGTRPHTRPYLVLWTLVGTAIAYLWFIAYAVTDRSSMPRNDAGRELATFRPLWGSTGVPFPKGAAYLRRIEAKTPEQLAVVQLKGVKLLAWAILLSLLQHFWFRLFHGFLHIPMPAAALAASVHGTPVPWHLRWASQILAFFELIFSMSILGHEIIACCRMAGFNALRNTYRPLSATTLIEFFNRFYYYYKELLVDFFYFPAFLRYFKKHRRLRTVFATFAAVVFGNAFYHITRDWQFFRDRGLWGGLASYQVEIVYCVMLAIGLSISQLRKRGARAKGFLRGHLLPVCGVGLFYVLISVFETDTRTFTVAQTVRYFASLFFIRL